MGTKDDHKVGVTDTRSTSWRDTLAADYEIQQARLRVEIDDSSEVEEFL